MFPNLEAEQARSGHTNAFVAEKLRISRQNYEHKKRKSGDFKLKEVETLLKMYNAEFGYLFSTDAQSA